jgi:uncharacterized protein
MQNQPQEIEVWYIIPAIRREIAKEMKSLGVSQVKISKTFGLSSAAISQYLSKKRGKNVEFPLEINKLVKAASKRLKEDPKCITEEIQKIVSEIRNSGLLCDYHKKYSSITKGCNVCMS